MPNLKFKYGTIELLNQTSLIFLLVLSVTWHCGKGSVTRFDNSVCVNFVPDRPHITNFLFFYNNEHLLQKSGNYKK